MVYYSSMLCFQQQVLAIKFWKVTKSNCNRLKFWESTGFHCPTISKEVTHSWRWYFICYSLLLSRSMLTFIYVYVLDSFYKSKLLYYSFNGSVILFIPFYSFLYHVFGSLSQFNPACSNGLLTMTKEQSNLFNNFFFSKMIIAKMQYLYKYYELV